jgi:hypothetical protein
MYLFLCFQIHITYVFEVNKAYYFIIITIINSYYYCY